MWARLDAIISPLGMFAKWRNGAPQTAAKENGIRDQVAQQQSPAAHVRFGSKADISA